MFYSIIVPLYNRPDEIRELLESLLHQTYKNFEVLVIEDGSKIPAEHIVESYKGKLDVHYYFKPNSGQGFARNYGFERAKGDYFIIFDSDIIVPPHYMEAVHHGVVVGDLDAFGGPDAAHESFTDTQKSHQLQHDLVLYHRWHTWQKEKPWTLSSTQLQYGA